MATIAATKVETPFSGDIVLYKYALAGGDEGEAVPIPRRQDVTIQAVGTFGAGNVTVQGVLDPAESTFIGLRDTAGVAISMTANDLQSILENVYLVKPVASAGITSVTVYILAR